MARGSSALADLSDAMALVGRASYPPCFGQARRLAHRHRRFGAQPVPALANRATVFSRIKRHPWRDALSQQTRIRGRKKAVLGLEERKNDSVPPQSWT